MLNIEELATKFSGVRWTGQDKFTARCPAHDDAKASLAVRQMGDRQVLYCFAGCTFEQVADALGMQKAEFFNGHTNGSGVVGHTNGSGVVQPAKTAALEVANAGSTPAPRTSLTVVDKPKPQQLVGPVETTRYEIKDIDGTVFAVHCREDGLDAGGQPSKRMWWETPDGQSGLGGIKAANLPLYGTELLRVAEPETTIVVTEGEKAARSLLLRGIAAVGTATGASNAPSEHVLQCLKPFNVVLWPDNDDHGRKHMARVGAVLEKIGCQARTLTWRDAPPKGDAADFVGGQAEIEGLLASVPAVREPTVTDVVPYVDRMAVDAYDAYTLMVREHREYSWEGLIKDGCTAVLSALIGSGKSTFSMNLARAWGMGEPFLDRICRQSRTLVVVSPKEYEAWIDTIGFWELKGLVYIVPSTAAHFSTHGQTAEWFDYQMKAFGCRTFILDTLFDFFGMPPNNSGDSNRIAMNEQTPLLQKVREQNYSGLVTGHAPKSEAKAIDPRDPEESFGGHTAWTAQHRMRMTIRRKSQGVNAFLTGRGGFGDKGILKEELLLFDENTRLDTLGGLFSDHLGEAAMPGVVDTLREFGEPVSMPQVIEAMGKSPKWVKAGMKTGRKKGIIDSDATKGKRDSKYWLIEQVHEHVLEQPKLL